MKIVCIGGGPAGLYFALLMKKQDPRHDITVVERNKPYDTFGWGVVFSDQTLGNVQADEQYPDADLIIASDGLNSRIRTRYAATYQPDIDLRQCRFVWLGTHKRFDAFTFAFRETQHGWFQAHAYQFDGDTSTFIIETPEEVWRAAGLEDMEQAEAIAFCERLFARYLDGHG